MEVGKALSVTAGASPRPTERKRYRARKGSNDTPKAQCALTPAARRAATRRGAKKDTLPNWQSVFGVRIIRWVLRVLRVLQVRRGH